jgi:hypothetical protein
MRVKLRNKCIAQLTLLTTEYHIFEANFFILYLLQAILVILNYCHLHLYKHLLDNDHNDDDDNDDDDDGGGGVDYDDYDDLMIIMVKVTIIIVII